MVEDIYYTVEYDPEADNFNSSFCNMLEFSEEYDNLTKAIKLDELPYCKKRVSTSTSQQFNKHVNASDSKSYDCQIFDSFHFETALIPVDSEVILKKMFKIRNNYKDNTGSEILRRSEKKEKHIVGMSRKTNVNVSQGRGRGILSSNIVQAKAGVGQLLKNEISLIESSTDKEASDLIEDLNKMLSFSENNVAICASSRSRSNEPIVTGQSEEKKALEITVTPSYESVSSFNSIQSKSLTENKFEKLIEVCQVSVNESSKEVAKNFLNNSQQTSSLVDNSRLNSSKQLKQPDNSMSFIKENSISDKFNRTETVLVKPFPNYIEVFDRDGYHRYYYSPMTYYPYLPSYQTLSHI